MGSNVLQTLHRWTVTTNCPVGSCVCHATPRNLGFFSLFLERNDCRLILPASYQQLFLPALCLCSLPDSSCTTIDYPKPHVSLSDRAAGSAALEFIAALLQGIFLHCFFMPLHPFLTFFTVLNSSSKSKFSYPINTSVPFLWFPFSQNQWQVLPHFHTPSHHNSLTNTLPQFLQSIQCWNLTGTGIQSTEENHSRLCFYFRKNWKK